MVPRARLLGTFTEPALFFSHRLTEQVVGSWIDRDGVYPKWSKATLDRAKRRNQPGGQTTRTHILANYPELVTAIHSQLTKLRVAGIALTVRTVRGLIVAQIEHAAPELFLKKAKDGSVFRAGEAWVRKWVFLTMGWVIRSSTKAAQKVPKDAEDQMKNSFLRMALSCRDAHITHPELIVNVDQTQVVYQEANSTTLHPVGDKQVPIVGKEEKRAFTLVVAVSAGGDLLPLYSIFQGKTDRSCPSKKSLGYAESEEMGFLFVPSGTGTYWASLETMQHWVSKILVPYWKRKKEELGLPQSQECILELDVWAVHRSAAFRHWLKATYPWIILEFVPGGCTGLWQPCDVGIQRVLKLSIKRSQHQDVVIEALVQLEEGTEPQNVRLKTDIASLRDRTVNWLVTAFKHINKPEIVKKAFEKCESGVFNLSFESITSAAALQELRNVQLNDPERWAKVNLRPKPQDELEGDFSNEDRENELLDDADDSALTMDALQTRTRRNLNRNEQNDPNILEDTEDGGLTLGGAAQDALDDEAFDWTAADEENRTRTKAALATQSGAASGEADEELGRGKRKRGAPRRYNDFYLH